MRVQWSLSAIFLGCRAAIFEDGFAWQIGRKACRKLAGASFTLAVFFVSGCATTASVKPVTSSRAEISEKEVISAMREEPYFLSGKRFKYVVAWNNIPVGNIYAEISEPLIFDGKKAYKVRLVTESNKFLSKIYRIEDTYISYVDAVSITSLMYEADRKEGNYRKHVVVSYDFDKMMATYSNLTDGSVKNVPIGKEIQDPLSAICYFMNMPLKPEEEVAMNVGLNEKSYRIFGKVGKVEVVDLAGMGTFPAFKIRPYAELERKKVEKGKAWLYFHADKERYPLYGVVMIPFGKITSSLIEVSDIRGNIQEKTNNASS